MKQIFTGTFKRTTDAGLSAITRRIVTNLKSDDRFASLLEQVTVIEKALTEYDDLFGKAAGGERAVISVKNAKKAALQALLAELAISVHQISKGDESIILSSGFDVSKDRGLRSKKPTIMDVKLGQPGEVTTSIARTGNTHAYIHQYTTDPLTTDSIWRSETTKSNSYRFGGLPSGVKHWFRIVIFSKDGSSIYVPPVACIIQ